MFGGCSRGLRLGHGCGMPVLPISNTIGHCTNLTFAASKGQHKVVVVAAAVIEGFGRTGGIRDAVMKKLGGSK